MSLASTATHFSKTEYIVLLPESDPKALRVRLPTLSTVGLTVADRRNPVQEVRLMEELVGQKGSRDTGSFADALLLGEWNSGNGVQ